MKNCPKCEVKKIFAKFYKESKNKYTSWCKECIINRQKKYARKNKRKIKKYQKKYRKEYYKKNKKKILKRHMKYYHENKESIKKWRVNYLKRNKRRISEKNQAYFKKLKKTNIQFKLACNLRNRLSDALKKNTKSGSAVKDLGCSIEDFKWWLEFWWEDGMSWDNYGNRKNQWSIDHIIPLSKVDLTIKEELLKVCHYTNLQPLWHCGENGNASKGNRILK
jgi:hypothetical protein